MLMYVIAGCLFGLWLLGLVAQVGGPYVHMLLAAAVILTLIRAVRSLNAATPENIP